MYIGDDYKIPNFFHGDILNRIALNLRTFYNNMSLSTRKL